AFQTSAGTDSFRFTTDLSIIDRWWREGIPAKGWDKKPTILETTGYAAVKTGGPRDDFPETLNFPYEGEHVYFFEVTHVEGRIEAGMEAIASSSVRLPLDVPEVLTVAPLPEWIEKAWRTMPVFDTPEAIAEAETYLSNDAREEKDGPHRAAEEV